MAAPVKRDEAVKDVKVETVLVPFAFALAKNGEVIMLGKGDIVADRFVEGKEGEANTLAHLRALGFIGSQD